MINSNRSQFVVVYDNSIIVDGIHQNGMPIYSSNPAMHFSSDSIAKSFIQTQINQILTTFPDKVIPSEISKYSVSHMVVNYIPCADIGNPTANIWVSRLDGLSEYESGSSGCESAKGFLKYVVLNGWKYAGIPKEMILDTLSNPKYKDIVESTVPMHMIENFDIFWENGIKTCSPDELGAIMLTTGDDILSFLEVDKYNVSR